MKKTVLLVILAVFLIALVPLFALKDAEFGGSDDAGSVVVEEVNSSYEAWATPVLEVLIGGELPGEVESLFFCLRQSIVCGACRLNGFGIFFRDIPKRVDQRGHAVCAADAGQFCGIVVDIMPGNLIAVTQDIVLEADIWIFAVHGVNPAGTGSVIQLRQPESAV